MPARTGEALTSANIHLKAENRSAVRVGYFDSVHGFWCSISGLSRPLIFECHNRRRVRGVNAPRTVDQTRDIERG